MTWYTATCNHSIATLILFCFYTVEQNVGEKQNSRDFSKNIFYNNNNNNSNNNKAILQNKAVNSVCDPFFQLFFCWYVSNPVMSTTRSRTKKKIGSK